MKDFTHFLVKRNDAERCLDQVDLCSDNEVMKCPCCCYFLDKRNEVIIEEIMNDIDELPEEVTIIKIPLLPTPSTLYYYSFLGIETIIYNLFKTSNKQLIEYLEKTDAFFKVYYEKDPLFTIPQIIIEIIFLNKLNDKAVDVFWKVLKSEIVLFTGAVGDIINLEINNSNDLSKVFHVPLLIGIDAFEFEGALKKYKDYIENTKELNYLHSVSIIYLKMKEIINNNKLTLFDDQRVSIQKELDEKTNKEDEVNIEIDSILGNQNQDSYFDDLPF